MDVQYSVSLHTLQVFCSISEWKRRTRARMDPWWPHLASLQSPMIQSRHGYSRLWRHRQPSWMSIMHEFTRSINWSKMCRWTAVNSSRVSAVHWFAVVLSTVGVDVQSIMQLSTAETPHWLLPSTRKLLRADCQLEGKVLHYVWNNVPGLVITSTNMNRFW